MSSDGLVNGMYYNKHLHPPSRKGPLYRAKDSAGREHDLHCPAVQGRHTVLASPGSTSLSSFASTRSLNCAGDCASGGISDHQAESPHAAPAAAHPSEGGQRRNPSDANRSETSEERKIDDKTSKQKNESLRGQGMPARQTAAGAAEARSATAQTAPAPGRPTFQPVTILEDLQAVRCAEFHPGGAFYAVGSNTKTLRICSYPKIEEIVGEEPRPPTVVFKRTKHHKGSIYCLGWSPAGDLLATGSNDKTVKLMKFNADNCSLEGQEVELTMHDGTVRDLCFIEDTTNRTSLLVTGGAGDCKIYITDCATGKPFQALSGHSGHVLSLYNWGGAMFVSGSQDKTVRFWDLRCGTCVNIVSPSNTPGYRGSPVTSVAVEPSGRLLVSAHEDATCSLYDVRGARALQRCSPHAADVRSARFSPGAYYLLTAGYDGRIVLTDLQGDLTCTLPSVMVARHPDKVISARWHPDDFSFVSTSADKTATLWTIPPL